MHSGGRASEILIFVAKKVNWNKVQDLLRENLGKNFRDFHPKVVLVKKELRLGYYKLLFCPIHRR